MTTVQSHPSPETAAAAQVQAFYERYPYPGPIDSLDPYRQLWADPQRRRADCSSLGCPTAKTLRS